MTSFRGPRNHSIVPHDIMEDQCRAASHMNFHTQHGPVQRPKHPPSGVSPQPATLSQNGLRPMNGFISPLLQPRQQQAPTPDACSTKYNHAGAPIKYPSQSSFSSLGGRPLSQQPPPRTPQQSSLAVLGAASSSSQTAQNNYRAKNAGPAAPTRDRVASAGGASGSHTGTDKKSREETHTTQSSVPVPPLIPTRGDRDHTGVPPSSNRSASNRANEVGLNETRLLHPEHNFFLPNHILRPARG